jgi:hypothetical protein
MSSSMQLKRTFYLDTFVNFIVTLDLQGENLRALDRKLISLVLRLVCGRNNCYVLLFAQVADYVNGILDETK